jgi:acetoin utilization deacetylase AcuC-like enzyme
MGGGGYDLDAVRRTWALEHLVMLGADIPAELHDSDPPEPAGDIRRAVDAAVDDAVAAALGVAFR